MSRNLDWNKDVYVTFYYKRIKVNSDNYFCQHIWMDSRETAVGRSNVSNAVTRDDTKNEKMSRSLMTSYMTFGDLGIPMPPFNHLKLRKIPITLPWKHNERSWSRKKDVNFFLPSFLAGVGLFRIHSTSSKKPRLWFQYVWTYDWGGENTWGFAIS